MPRRHITETMNYSDTDRNIADSFLSTYLGKNKKMSMKNPKDEVLRTFFNWLTRALEFECSESQSMC